MLTIDLATGEATEVGGIAPPGATNYKRPGLAINSHGEILVTDAELGTGLYSVDAATGAQSFVGPILDGSPAAPRWIEGIAFDENDTLYGLSYDSGEPEGDTPAVLFTIDTTDGTATRIGDTGAGAEFASEFSGLAFDPTDGTLWASQGGGIPAGDGIYTIDKNTGAATLVGTMGFGGATPDIAFDSAGNLYGLKGGGGSGEKNLISINKQTGKGKVIGSLKYEAVSGMDCYLVEPPTVTVGIDIKPGSEPNSINLCSRGSVPIAILGSGTFWVNDINTDTLRFAEASVKVVGKKDPNQLCHYEDVNDDFIDDLVCQFLTADIAALNGESTSNRVAGELFNGTPIVGTDSVNIVKDSCY